MYLVVTPTKNAMNRKQKRDLVMALGILAAVTVVIIIIVQLMG